MRKRFAGAMVVFGGILLFAAGCATTGHKGTVSRQAAVTRKKTAVTSRRAVVAPRQPVPSRPAWVAKGMDYWVEGKQIVLRECWIDGEKAVALKGAECAARVRLAKNIRDLMLAEFRREISERKADAKTSEALVSSFDTAADRTKIEGITRTDWYVEKTGIKGAKKGSAAYRVYVLVKISMTDYDKSLRQTLAALRARVAGNKGERRLVDAVNAGLPAKLL